MSTDDPSGTTETRAAPPPLLFDDGSRIMNNEPEEAPSASSRGATSSCVVRDGGTPIAVFYEVDRLVREIQALEILHQEESLRVALQFPDELLADAPEVCWELEQALSSNALVFCLGDTTLGDCCPDVVAAQHLQANVLVHFGQNACLSPCEDLPVLYSFGKGPLDVSKCVNKVLEHGVPMKRLLLLYQVQYHHAMEELQTRLSEQGDLQVIMGQIPDPVTSTVKRSCGRRDCCSSDAPSDDAVNDETSTKGGAAAADVDTPVVDDSVILLVGLELPKNLDWSSYTLLFVGDASSRQYLELSLRFHSTIHHVLTFDPISNGLSTNWSPQCQRVLKRRFYLVQKARQANVVGVLVANLSDTRMRQVVNALLAMLEQHGRSAYVFVVGKINVAKLANFAEIECFVLVACPEQSLVIDAGREFSVPIVTPLEMAMALGCSEWGGGATTGYSVDLCDFLAVASSSSGEEQQVSSDVRIPDRDAPYFSLVTGQYQSQPQRRLEKQRHDLTQLPGHGVLTNYSSVAADFLKQREYQGLQPNVGLTPIQPAVPGQHGIASDYGSR